MSVARYLFDVRPKAEWEAEHVVGTINILKGSTSHLPLDFYSHEPLPTLPQRIDDPTRFPRRRIVYILGTPSKNYEDAYEAFPVFKKAGFPKVFVLEGVVLHVIREICCVS